MTGGIKYRVLVERTPIVDLSVADIDGEDLAKDSTRVRDPAVRRTLRRRLAEVEGDLKKAMSEPLILDGGSSVVQKVRLERKRQLEGMRRVHNGLSDPENKHHVAIYKRADGTYRGSAVSMFDVAKRITQRLPTIDKSPADGSSFIMSLSKGDVLELPDPRAQYWVVRELKSNGQVTLVPHIEARPTKQAVNYKPTVGGLMRLNPRKVAVDPIGRVRPAND
ncbi:MAG: hypothetical protein IT553_09925 [Sphingomonadaceae bacterium]|nr:hypothetical protein [Sphingomonadaceae bacterium]